MKSILTISHFTNLKTPYEEVPCEHKDVLGILIKKLKVVVGALLFIIFVPYLLITSLLEVIGNIISKCDTNK